MVGRLQMERRKERAVYADSPGPAHGGSELSTASLARRGASSAPGGAASPREQGQGTRPQSHAEQMIYRRGATTASAGPVMGEEGRNWCRDLSRGEADGLCCTNIPALTGRDRRPLSNTRVMAVLGPERSPSSLSKHSSHGEGSQGTSRTQSSASSTCSSS